MEAPSLHDAIAGSLYGLLVGDALGCPVEGWEPSKIEEVWGELETMEETSGDRWRPLGLHSDDGQQAMALCDAIARDPEHPESHLARILVEMAKGERREGDGPGCHRGTGRNFREMMFGLRRGGDPWSAAQHSAGNGVAMMIAPVGWWYRDDDTMLMRKAVSIGLMKTTDVRGIAAGAAVAWCVAHALGGQDVRTELAELVAFTREAESLSAERRAFMPHVHTFSDALAAMVDSIDAPRSEVLETIAQQANLTSAKPGGPSAAYAPASVVTSIYLAISAKAFDEALITAVNLGEDADTVGAMVGAIAGARFGLGAIPVQWMEALVARGAFDDRVEAMVTRKAGFVPVRSLESLERGWSAIRK